jgi:hypothetical protein
MIYLRERAPVSKWCQKPRAIPAAVSRPRDVSLRHHPLDPAKQRHQHLDPAVGRRRGQHRRNTGEHALGEADLDSSKSPRASA